MDRLSEAETLKTAWRALAESMNCNGWRTIPITEGKHCRLLAGRHFPGNEEAVLVGLCPVQIPAKENLPEGCGFTVNVVDLGMESEKRLWFALLRQEFGSLEMFTIMAADIVSTIVSSELDDGERLLELFLGRIRAWQRFMHHSKNGVLSSEAEIGLHGELVILESLLHLGLSPVQTIEAWYGPLDGVQDFLIGTGAIEVKTTVSSGGFAVKVTSLEQLDNSLVNPLFLAGVHLRPDESGLNLPDRVAVIQNMLQPDSLAMAVFEFRLLHAGFSRIMSSHYPRRFSYDRTRIILVDNYFPSLTRANIPNEIRKVSYEIDLNLVKTADISLKNLLQTLGVL